MKLLGTSNIGGRIEKWWLHTDAAGNDVITTEVIQDVDPVIHHVRQINETSNPKSDFRYRGTIPYTVLDEICRVKALEWGISRREVYSEVMSGRTDRAQKIMRMLIEGRDYRKLQAEKRRQFI